MLNRLDKEHFYFCPPTKLLTNNLLNSLNKVMVFGGNFLNHTLVGPFKVVGKALHIISSVTPCRCMVVLNVAMWSQGSCISSYESKVGVLNLEGKGWLVMDAVKGESVLWTRSSTWLTLTESFHFFHSSLHLVHFSLQVWYPMSDNTSGLVLFNIVFNTFTSWILASFSTMLLMLPINFSS